MPMPLNSLINIHIQVKQSAADTPSRQKQHYRQELNCGSNLCIGVNGPRQFSPLLLNKLKSKTAIHVNAAASVPKNRMAIWA
jgi:hypothetical protein